MKDILEKILDELEYRIILENGSGKWVDKNAKLKNQHIIEFIKEMIVKWGKEENEIHNNRR